MKGIDPVVAITAVKKSGKTEASILELPVKTVRKIKKYKVTLKSEIANARFES